MKIGEEMNNDETDGKTDSSMPAFPRDHRYDGHNGIDIRDYFAAKAISAAYSDYLRDGCPPSDRLSKIAEACYAMADAMIAARDK